MENTDLIYYVEDDEKIRELALYTLRMSGFEVQGFTCAREFFDACAQQAPSLILLDIMLPEVNGIDILKTVRKDPVLENIPVMMLTAKDTEYDTVLGLDAGADDYLAKPFGMMELVSRVKALLRMTHRMGAKPQESSEDMIRRNGFVVDIARHDVSVDGKPVVLTVKEFDLLSLLMQHEGRVFSRGQLLEQVWDMADVGETRTVDVHVRSLRQKLSEASAGADEAIKTIRGVGYVFKLAN